MAIYLTMNIKNGAVYKRAAENYESTLDNEYVHTHTQHVYMYTLKRYTD